MGIEIARVKRRPCVDFLHAPGRWLAAVASSGSPRALVPIQTSRLAGEVLEVRVVDLALAYLFTFVALSSEPSVRPEWPGMCCPLDARRQAEPGLIFLHSR